MRSIFSSMLAAAMSGFVSVQAGSLEPPGPPAPTLLRTPSHVARTGQTACWDPSGAPVSCAGTGQDGAHQAGASVGPRFTDNGNGTVKDNLTGLVWLKHASCFGAEPWADALSHANTLASGACGLTDGSAAGAWRLPNLAELLSLIDYGRAGPALPANHPFSGVSYGNYWSSTTCAAHPIDAWRVLLNDGFVSHIDKASSLDVWPVRDGQ
jgi:hypothetical protein